MPDYNDYGLSRPMGEKLRKEIERQLAEDIKHYGIDRDGLKFDWSESTGEGHWQKDFDGYLENYSGISVFDEADVLVAEGWMDFIYEKQDNLLIAYWDILDISSNSRMVQVKDFGVPDYILKKLPDHIKSRY